MKLALEKLAGDGKHIMLINMAVVVFLAYVASLWVNLFISGMLASRTPYTPPKTAAFRSAPKPDYSVIKRRNIFNPGVDASRAALASGSGDGAVPTSLNVKLLGTIITERDENNMAVISDAAGGDQKLYRVSDFISPGARVIRIERFTVFLDNSGAVEVLTMEFEGLPATAAGGIPGRILEASAQLSGLPVRDLGGDRYLMDRRFLQNELNNMNNLMVQIRAVPEKGKEGDMVGFRLFQIVKNSIYEKIGLKENDILQRVNGQPLNSAEKGLDLFMALKNEKHFDLDLLRNEAKRTVTVDIQ